MLARLRESFAYTRRTLGLVWKSSPAAALALALTTLVGSVVPLGVAYAGKRIVDAVVQRDRDLTLRFVLVELSLVAALALTQRGVGLVRSLLGARLGIDINVAILEKALGLELRYFEDAEFYDKLTRARREASSRPVALVTESFQLVQSLITLVGFAAVLTALQPARRAGAATRDAPGHDRRDALFEGRISGAQLALARVAAPFVSRARSR